MDSLPQELIEAIIDDLPRHTLRSSSLIASRWRTRSQQRILDSIAFFSQDMVDRWCSDAQGGGNRIMSYVRSAEFRGIESWNEPALFGRALKGLRSLKTLKVYGCAIPDELPGQILRGEFGRGIITLSLRVPRCDLSTTTSMILSLPDLKNLTVILGKTTSTRLTSTSITPQRRQLDMLELYLFANEVAEALIQSGFTFRYICSGGVISSILRLLEASSETLVALTLEGAQLFAGSRATEAILTIFEDTGLTGTPTPSIIDLSSFPTLTSVRVRFHEGGPSRRTINILSSISSAPALASVEFQCGHCKVTKLIPSNGWDDLDKWLALTAKHAAVGRGLVLTPRRWIFSESYWEGLLPRFREAGGEIKTHADGWINYDRGFGDLP